MSENHGHYTPHLKYIGWSTALKTSISTAQSRNGSLIPQAYPVTHSFDNYSGFWMAEENPL